ncbi:hypothetical protein K5D36_09070 [Pseudomonas cichorii]|nr:hypothetical protein [Pseudomonas cichorii]
MNMALHTLTPTLIVIDPRGLAIRNVAFYRSEPDEPVDERVNSQTCDAAGRLVSQRDPRLSIENLRTTYSLSNQALLTESVDAGWRLGLLNEAGLPVEGWDSRGSRRQVEYDAVLRPLAIIEDGLVTERLGYGGTDGFEHNQCNQLIRHDDTAGTLLWSDYSVIGSAITETRDFLKALETPDWPLTETDRDALLENDPLQTRHTFNALGEAIEQTDAMGNMQRFRQTVAGQLKSVALILAGTTQAQTLVGDIRYNAFDQVEQETAGNGVVSLAVYEASNGLLQSLSASRTGNETLQSLHYSYDPVGNILQIEDTVQPVRFFANQRIEPVSRYTYDTLYQLIEATGREVNSGASHGPALPGLQPLPPDPNQVSNYTQSYDYDPAGNLLQMRHVGAQSFTRTMRVAPDSNRSLPEGEVDADFNEAFDANGNLLHLIRGQTLEWDIRNQLQQITTVTRTTKASDHERYIYDGQGQRCRKINSTQTSSRTLNNEVRYLPGLEIRTTADGEVLHVITAQNSRVLHWQAGQPSGIANDQIRYSLSDHLGSSTLELDQQGGLISQESCYPFGGTAWWAARSAVEAKYKTVRYSGKERDASGLYYYGFRYYAPWLQRWINPDPAGNVNGLNLFCFVGNTPVLHNDLDGRIYEGKGDKTEEYITSHGDDILFRGLREFPEDKRKLLVSALKKTSKFYKHASYMAKHYPSEIDPILRSFYGPGYAAVAHKVTSTWKQTYMLASEYKEKSGHDKFIGIKTASGRDVAYVMHKDPHGRIAINTQRVESQKLPITVGHELLHLRDVRGIKTKGSGLHDYYYIYFSSSALGQGAATRNRNDYAAVAEAITSGGLSRDYFSKFDELGRSFTRKVDSFNTTRHAIKDLDSALNEFNRNPSVSARISAENPDSIIFSAYYVHKLYKKKFGTPKRAHP